MQAIEFEADIQDGMVKIPDEYGDLKNRHARIVVLYENSTSEPSEPGPSFGLDFSSVNAPTLTTQEGVEYQRSMRDEW
ncbi:hypothetical protein LG331_12030 [Vreelandella aquamarina]|uniref:hypothetical protein n=1 Tax=Vreelandella aquamarina TaxID=77097 RepID=UPI00384AD4FE